MKHFYPMLLCMAIVAYTVSSCKSDAQPVSSKIESFPVIQPLLVDTIFTKEYIAQIHSLQNVEIRTHVKGFIEKIHVDEGKQASAGQVLFTLGGKEFKENLLKANASHKTAIAELKMAEVELKNTRALAEQNIVSSSELELAIARKEAAEAKIEETKSAISIASLNLSYTEVKAPFTGVINRIPFKTGSLVGEGELLTTISNNQEVFAYFNVSEKEFLELAKKNKVGDYEEVSLLMANNEPFPFTGRIETAENEIDKSTGNIAFRARFKNPSAILRHGATGKILLKEELKKSLIVPQKATFEIQDKTFVYVVDSSNTVRLRNIVPGVRLSTLYSVNKGLAASDRVILEGIQQVKEGRKITPLMVDMPRVITN